MDKTRVGIWGSSYSGGHVLVVAAIDRRVKCVVSQVALIRRLLTLPGGHFEAYVGHAFEVSSPAQRDWFVEHLRP